MNDIIDVILNPPFFQRLKKQNAFLYCVLKPIHFIIIYFSTIFLYLPLFLIVRLFGLIVFLFKEFNIWGKILLSVILPIIIVAIGVLIYDISIDYQNSLTNDAITEDTVIKEMTADKSYYTLHIDTTPPKNPGSSGGSSTPDTSLDRYLETDIISPPTEIDASEIIISKTATAYCGDMANVSVRVEPNTEYHIAVYYSSGRSSADGLYKKTSDKDGYISWSWRIGSRTRAGEYRIEIYNSEKTYVTSFIVK